MKHTQWAVLAALTLFCGAMLQSARGQSVAGGGVDSGQRGGGVQGPYPTPRPTARGNQGEFLSGAQGGAHSSTAGGGTGSKRLRKKPMRTTAMKGVNRSGRRRKFVIAQGNVMGGSRAARLNRPSRGGFMARTAVLKGRKPTRKAQRR